MKLLIPLAILFLLLLRAVAPAQAADGDALPGYYGHTVKCPWEGCEEIFITVHIYREGKNMYVDWYISGPLAHSIESKSLVTHLKEDKSDDERDRIDFDFDDDGWGNSGHGQFYKIGTGFIFDLRVTGKSSIGENADNEVLRKEVWASYDTYQLERQKPPKISSKQP